MNKFKFILINPIFLWFNYLFKSLYIKISENSVFVDYMSFCNSVKFGENISIGRYSILNNCSIGSYTYTSNNCTINNASIGRFCSLGSGVKIGLGKHPTRDFVSTHPLFYSTRKQLKILFVNQSIFEETQKVIIGNDVWIGANAVILDGVRIGDGAIVSAGAIVNKDVPDYSIFGGVPAKFIKFRFEEGEIIYLQNLKWWNKDLAWLKIHSQYFNRIKDLISNT